MPGKNRRSFIRDSAVFVAGAVGGIAGGLFPVRSRAIEPIKRNGAAKFKLSVAAYSYRNLLAGSRPKLTLDDFVTDCAKMGMDGVELTSYYFPKNVTHEYLRHLKHLTFRLGLDISGTAVGNDFCHAPGPERDRQIAMVKMWIDYSEILGAPVIRIFCGSPHGGLSAESAHALAVQSMEECCDYAGKHGVFLALENHGGLTETAEGTQRLLKDVKSPWFGANLDTGNFHGKDIYEDLAKIAPYSINTHLKATVAGPDHKKVPTDFKRLAKLLTDAGYRGYLVLEYEEDEDPRAACPRIMDQVREACA